MRLRYILISLFLFNLSAFPQTFGIGGGLSTVEGPDSYTSNNLTGGGGFSNGYHIVAKLKIGIPLFPLTPVGSIIYHHFSGKLGSTIQTSQSIWSIAAGGEYKFIPGQLSPYIVADLEYNNFGDLDIEAPDGLPEIIVGESAISGSRMGGAIGIGAELTILPVIGIDASIKYHFMNWIGKEPSEETVSVISYNLTMLF